MKFQVMAFGLLFFSLNTFAMKPCGELKNEIADKLDAKGVTGYTLTIVDNADVSNQTVVGSCEAGTKKITYTRNAAPAPTEIPAETQP